MTAITLTIEDAELKAALARLTAGLRSPAPLYKAIGEDLVQSTKDRFASSTGPDGQRWAPNSEATFLAFVDKFTKTTRKDGRLNAKGAGVVMGKKPLVGESGSLSSQIFYNLIPGGLEVGSTMEYAAMQQFGGTIADWPHLWGDIPARPFLGVSAADTEHILDEIQAYLSELLD